MAPSFYSDMQDAAKARLILIRGEGMDGLSYHLKADQHVIGRQGQLEFPDDPFISPGGMAASAAGPVVTRVGVAPGRKVRTPQGAVVGNAHRPVSGRESATESKPPPGGPVGR